jgi:hypothetical protein
MTHFNTCLTWIQTLNTRVKALHESILNKSTATFLTNEQTAGREREGWREREGRRGREIEREIEIK